MKLIFRYCIIFRLIFKLILLKFRYSNVRFIRVKRAIGSIFSQDGQDLYILPILFKNISLDKENWLVDVGANHPIEYSNTFLFEKYFGCKTIAIEPLQEFESTWNIERPQAEFISLALGSTRGETQINVPINGDTMFSNVSGGVNKNIHVGGYESRVVKVDTLTNILKKRGIFDVLLLSIDVEGYEIEVLKGIDFDKISFRVIVCENNSDGMLGDNSIRDYIISQGYIYYARLGWNDDLFINHSILKSISSSK